MRDENGRFIPGNPGSPGRPKRQTEIDYMGMLQEALTPAKWKQIVNTAISNAIAGDTRARRWISDYVLGKPVQTLELIGTEQAQLAELLQVVKAQGLSAGDLFNAMLRTIAEQPTEGVQNDEL